jgi:hypothetical protein
MLALFPNLTIARMTRSGDQLTLTLRNDGDATIRAAEYGQPAYRAVLKVFDGNAELQDRWLALRRDVRPGEEATMAFDLDRRPASGNRPLVLRLYHALESVPIVAELPAAEVEIPLVR